MKWRTSLIAWANDAGVKVYDAANDQRITFIERPRGSPHPELLLPHLVWQVSFEIHVFGFWWGILSTLSFTRSLLHFLLAFIKSFLNLEKLRHVSTHL